MFNTDLAKERLNVVDRTKSGLEKRWIKGGKKAIAC